MKRIKRDPWKYDIMELIDEYGRRKNIDLTDPTCFQDIITKFSNNIQEVKNNTRLIHGKRIESMFEYVAASLRNCEFIQQLDKGGISSENPKLKLPDYLIALKNDKRVLIEVKNCHSKEIDATIKIKKEQVIGLNNYSKKIGIDLFIAVYWSQFKYWTLVDLNKFSSKNNYSMSFEGSILYNRMNMLGDLLLMAKLPLMLTIEADKIKPNKIELGGKTVFTIKEIKIYCGSTEIQNYYEKTIAHYLMLYSFWKDVRNEVNHTALSIDSINFIFTPEETLGFLSTMISKQYNQLTTQGNIVTCLAPNINSGGLGIHLTEKYLDNELKFLRFDINPKGNER